MSQLFDYLEPEFVYFADERLTLAACSIVETLYPTPLARPACHTGIYDEIDWEDNRIMRLALAEGYTLVPRVHCVVLHPKDNCYWFIRTALLGNSDVLGLGEEGRRKTNY